MRRTTLKAHTERRTPITFEKLVGLPSSEYRLLQAEARYSVSQTAQQMVS